MRIKNFITCLLYLSVAFSSPVALGHDPAEEMAVAANRFLSSLDDEQRKVVAFDFGSDQRQQWHYLPDFAIDNPATSSGKGRVGARLDALSDGSQVYAHQLLNSGLTHRGYLTATSIMALEQILGELENNPQKRDAGRYYVSVFGKPAATGTWAWRFEGHHLSLNVTVKDGKLFSVTPTFFGTNPAQVKQGEFKGMEVLAKFESLGFELIGSLNDSQRKAAIISKDAIEEVVTGEDTKVNRKTFLPVVGLTGEKMTGNQRQVMQELVQQYTGTYRPEIVQKTSHAKLLESPEEWTFAWYGSTDPGKAHYFRVQSGEFVFEVANVQNNANHVHAVWRDFDGDFGRDLLGEHYRVSHTRNVESE